MTGPAGDQPRPTGLTALIRRRDPEVKRLLAQADRSSLATDVDRLCEVLRCWQFDLRLGPSERYPYGHGNCIDLAALLTACLRERGRRAYTLIGSRSGQFPAGVHAWTLTAQRAGWWLVDPEEREPRPCDPMELNDKYTILAIFDDEVAYLAAEDRLAFLKEARDAYVGDTAPSGAVVDRAAG